MKLTALFLLLFSTAVDFSSTHNPFIQHCRYAPTPVKRILCEQIQEMDIMARAQQIVEPSKKPPSVVLNPAYECQNISCLCPYFHGKITEHGNFCVLRNGKRLEKSVRKEIRHLTDEERERFHRAMNTLKQSGEYHRIGGLHSLASHQGGVHTGPAFLPWHREYIKRVEIAIRLLEPDLALPYWDSVLDQRMPDARDSILWSPIFYGECDWRGNVKNGPFVNWTTIEGNAQINRDVGGRETLFTDTHLKIIQEQQSVTKVMAYTAPRVGCPIQPEWDSFEYLHGNPHQWVGGEMVDPETSVNDPIFFQHHSFVDLIWERWRLAHQSRSSRETDYPEDIEDCSNVQHFSNADMYPFAGLRNRDGLSNHYTDVMYTFEARPTCSARSPDCGSAYLFCDVANQPPRCIAKATEGGRCDGFEETAICYNGRCQNGRCVSSDYKPDFGSIESGQLNKVVFDAKQNAQQGSLGIMRIFSVTVGIGLMIGLLWAVLPVVSKRMKNRRTISPLLETSPRKTSEYPPIFEKSRQVDFNNKYGSNEMTCESL